MVQQAYIKKLIYTRINFHSPIIQGPTMETGGLETIISTFFKSSAALKYLWISNSKNSHNLQINASNL